MLQKKLEELALEQAIGQYLSDAPEDHEAFLRWYEGETDEMPEDMVVWEPFDNDDNDRMRKLISDAKDAALHLLQTAVEMARTADKAAFDAAYVGTAEYALEKAVDWFAPRTTDISAAAVSERLHNGEIPRGVTLWPAVENHDTRDVAEMIDGMAYTIREAVAHDRMLGVAAKLQAQAEDEVSRLRSIGWTQADFARSMKELLEDEFGDVPSAKRINLISLLEISRQVLECPSMTKLVAESMDVSDEEMSRLREGLNSFMEGETAEQPPIPLTPMQKAVLEHYQGGEFAHLASVRESEEAGDGLLTFLLREIGDVAGNSGDRDAVDESVRALYVVSNQVIEVARNLQAR